MLAICAIDAQLRTPAALLGPNFAAFAERVNGSVATLCWFQKGNSQDLPCPVQKAKTVIPLGSSARAKISVSVQETITRAGRVLGSKSSFQFMEKSCLV
jgi:hypothetical protein